MNLQISFSFTVPQKATKGHRRPQNATKYHKIPQKATKGYSISHTLKIILSRAFLLLVEICKRNFFVSHLQCVFSNTLKIILGPMSATRN